MTMDDTAEISGAARGRDAFVAAQKGWLVLQGNELGAKAGARKDWASQGRGLLEACRHEAEPEVILNLLRYQAARVGSWNEVSGPLEIDIRKCQQLATEAGDPEAAMELIRLLLLYALRAHKHEVSLKKEEDQPGGKGQ